MERPDSQVKGLAMLYDCVNYAAIIAYSVVQYNNRRVYMFILMSTYVDFIGGFCYACKR